MEAATASFDALAGGRSRPPAPRAQSFAVHGRVLRVTSGDAWVTELLDSAYAPLRCASATVHEDESIASPGGFVPAFYALRDRFALCASNVPGSLALYGAVVAIGGRAVLILGSSTAGKSILAMNLASFGGRLLGDELALLHLRDGTLSAVPRAPSVREPGLPFLLDVDLRERIQRCTRALRTPRGRLWYGLDAQTVGFAADARAYRLSAVFVIKSRADRAAIDCLPYPNLAGAVLRRAHRPVRDLDEVAALHAILRDLPAYEVQIGGPGETADLVMGALTQCA